MRYRSNGKILLTGEYLILDGASGLALPTKPGQQLIVKPGNNLQWESLGLNNEVWFSAELDPETLDILASSDRTTAQSLKELLEAAAKCGANPERFNDTKVSTILEFERDWGLGSSSTLINNVCAWLMVDPLKVHFHVSNGSGYDIVAGNADGAVIYQLNPDPEWFEVPFAPTFKSNIWFIHLGRKAKSDLAVGRYRDKSKPTSDQIQHISEITISILKCNNLGDFNKLIVEHESILSEVLKSPTIKQQLFSDFQGEIKSLGAWGGDFVLATGTEADMQYFADKGYNTILSYDALIL